MKFSSKYVMFGMGWILIGAGTLLTAAMPFKEFAGIVCLIMGNIIWWENRRL